MSFERNLGQTDDAVKFFSHGRGYNLFLTPAEAVFVLSSSSRAAANKIERADTTRHGRKRLRQNASVLRIKLKNANADAHLEGINELSTRSNYYIGNDPKKWRTGVPHFRSVWAENVYPGINVHYYGNQHDLEYDFIVEPKVDPNVITLAIDGAEKIEIDNHGDLTIRTPVEQLKQRKPFVYQEIEGARKEISSKYVIKNKNEVAFELGPYDRNKHLIIDPQLLYSTYLGGEEGEVCTGIGVDAQGNAYVTGTATSINFPTSGGAFDPARGDLFYEDAFVTKLNPTGTAIVYSTYIGGIYGDDADDIAVDLNGNAYVSGDTSSPDYPVTFNAYQPVHAGLDPADEDLQNVDGFVSRFTNQGTLVYSTFLGGSGDDIAFAIAVDENGNACVAGSTDSTDFPLTSNAFQTTPPSNIFDHAFVSKLNTSGSTLLYSSYLGGSSLDRALGVAVDADNIYVAGQTLSNDFPTSINRTGPGFIAKFNPTLSGSGSRIYSTRVNFVASGVAVDRDQHAYVAGDASVQKLDSTGQEIFYTASVSQSSISDIVVDRRGTVFVTGSTSSSQFPATPGAVQSVYNGGGDAFIAKLKASNGAILYASFLGGSDTEIGMALALDIEGKPYVAGSTRSETFPVTTGAFQTSAHGNLQGFITKFDPPPPPLIFIPGIAGTELCDRDAFLAGCLWPGYLSTFTNHKNLSLDPREAGQVPPHIIATQAVGMFAYKPLLDALQDRGGYRKYDDREDPFRRTILGCDLTQSNNHPDLSFFLTTGVRATLTMRTYSQSTFSAFADSIPIAK